MANRAKMFGTTLLAGSFILAQVTPTFATIDNTANAVGTTPAGVVTNFPAAPPVNVPVAVNAALTVTKISTLPTTALGTDATITDQNDTITFTVTITNTGNQTMTNVSPTDAGPKFNGLAGTSLTPFTLTPASVASLAPGAPATFTGTYTLTQLDIDRSAGVAAAVSNTAGATGTSPSGPYTAPPANQGSVTTTIAAGPKLTVQKVAVIAKFGTNAVVGKAELGDTINYTYTVTNSGNVAMTNVTVKDLHGPTPGVQVGTGALIPGIIGGTLISDGPLSTQTPGPIVSADATANDGKYDLLQPGAVVTFTWAHVVTQAEIDHG